MNYKETLDYLYQKLPAYQREGAAAYKKDIGNIVAAAQSLNNPHLQFKSIHIAGTNGKGSTAHLIASIMQEAGYKVGLYTSPHLTDFRERIKINGKMISKQNVIDFVLNNKKLFEDLHMSFFEMTVIMSFDYFANNKVDIAIIETGLGGRLDSTNIINPELAIITNISLDHTNLLGNTIQKIAAEKAGIIKEGTTVVIGKKQKATENIFNKVVNKKKANILYAKMQKDSYISDLKGTIQKENISTCISAIKQMQKKGWNISEKNIKDGIRYCIKNTQLLGRWQILQDNPTIICDIAHNIDGIKQVIKQVKERSYNKLHLIIGVNKDKSISKILTELPKDAKYYFCSAKIERSLHQKKLKEKAKEYNLFGDAYSSVNSAIKNAKKNAEKNDLILISGSTFVIAEII